MYPTSLLNIESQETLQEIDWIFYLLKTDSGRWIMFDSGFIDEKYIPIFGIKNFRSPIDILKKLDLISENVTDIFISHSHFDHIDGIKSFPNAKIYIQEKEYFYFKTSDIYLANKDFYDNLFAIGNIVLLSGETSIFGFLQVYPSYGHTPGSQAFKINTDSIDFILTGDECYITSECLKGVSLPKGAVYNSSNNKKFIQMIQRPSKNFQKKIILTMHDPINRKIYKKIESFIQLIYQKNTKNK